MHLCSIGCCYMFVALYECLFVLRGALSYPGGVGAVAGPVPRSGVGGAMGAESPDRSPGPRWGRPRGEAGGPGGAPRADRGYARGVPGHPRGLLELPQALRGAPSRPRVSPKTRPSFNIHGFIKDENRFLKNYKSHPEVHRVSPKASQELPRVPQVASTAPPRVPQGTPKSPWEGGGPPGHPWEDMGGDPWGPWGSLGVIGGPLGALGGHGGLRGSPRGAFEICVFRASQTRAQSSPEPPLMASQGSPVCPQGIKRTPV